MICGSICPIFWLAAALGSSVLVLPYGKLQRLASPNHGWVLYQVPHGASGGPELWIEDVRMGRRPILNIPDTLRAGWFPDSAAFWVENHWASDRTDSYIYDPLTLKRLDLRSAVLAADPSIRRLDDGHRYYRVTQVFADGLLINLAGHTDRAPVDCFEIRYRVSRGGAVTKLAQRLWRAGTAPCR